MLIALTGGAGYIGSHTAIALLEAGHQVLVIDNFCNSRPEAVGRLEQLSGKSIPSFPLDLRNTAALEAIFRGHQIDAVMHFAGLKAVGESVSNPLAYYNNNVQGTISLLHAMQATGTRTLIFSSSATVYGDPQYLPIDEAHPLSQTNPYGRTKAHIEEILRDLAQSDSGWRIACLRYFNPAGAHSSGQIGEDPAGTPNNLMPVIMQVVTKKLPLLKVFGSDYSTPDGTGIRDYIHVMDLAEGHLAALDFVQNRPGWHAINLGTGRGTSVLELIAAFEQTTGQSVPYQIAPRRPGDVASCFASAALAAQALDWVAKRSVQEMCHSAWQWQQFAASITGPAKSA